uniref:Dehydrogenase/reductase (SDR family) member 13a, duplicate 3 n=1 Tax=Anabas testudineus TaxID=64144 RepID=A0A7N6AY25_ANATE
MVLTQVLFLPSYHSVLFTYMWFFTFLSRCKKEKINKEQDTEHSSPVSVSPVLTSSLVPCDQETGNNQVILLQLDLASLKSVRSFVENVLRTESRLDLLINNAGLMNDGKTQEGFGMIFGVNHLGHFLLTVLLLDRLKASGPSRVVTVASRGYEYGKIDFNCLTTHRDFALGDNDYQLFLKYCHSKLCNVLFTYELAKRLQDSNVTCYSLHPGVIKTEIGRNAKLWMKILFAPVSLLLTDAESGAQTTLHCALEQGIEHLSGHYFTHCAPLLNVMPKARDDAAAKKLWELSESFCGLS